MPSTNDLALQLARQGAPHGTVVVAEVQTAGRGRRGRSWSSPSGGLWMSVVLRPDLPAGDVNELASAAGQAVARAIHRIAGVEAALRPRQDCDPPNDVLVKTRKVAGILAETEIQHGRLLHAVVGIGINANFPLSALAPSLRTTATTLLAETGAQVNLTSLQQAVVDEVLAARLPGLSAWHTR